MDIKTPGSGESGRNLWSNLEHIKKADQIKFVICSRADYDWAKQVFAEHGLADKCSVLFSPAQGQLVPRELAEWILEDRLTVRLRLEVSRSVPTREHPLHPRRRLRATGSK